MTFDNLGKTENFLLALVHNEDTYSLKLRFQSI